MHFPWCLQKCPYCDFLSIARPSPEIPRAEYTLAIQRELRLRAPRLAGRPVASVFFGGGTPSLWGAGYIGQVLDEISSRFSFVGSGVEITVECNPSSFSEQVARELKQAGVNRVSIGVQSLDASRLRFLGRLHDRAGALSAVQGALQAGIDQVSADLIFGVHGQSAHEAAAEVDTVAALGVHHLSAYALTIEPGTAFGALNRKGKLPLLGEDQVAHSFNLVEQTLAERGFAHYEVSNYAKPGHEAQHNLGYWRGADYLGLGCGAWGTLRDEQGAYRYRNTPVAERYMDEQHWPEPVALEAHIKQPYQAFERLSRENLLLERLMLGLRLAEGVDVQALEAELQVQVLDAQRRPKFERLERQGRIRLEGTRLVIPQQQWLLADGTISALA